ncbi:MAG: hypothetical protein WBQ89_20485, partial [Candidatus Acidiferrum sp.]
MHRAEEWEEGFLPEVEHQQEREKVWLISTKAAFAKPEICEATEERGVPYTIRLWANDNLAGQPRGNFKVPGSG